jgi:hypothetical protein
MSNLFVRYFVIGLALALGCALMWFVIWPWIRSW